MSWSATLLDASYRGIGFDCLATDDSAQRALQLTEYPYRDGATVDDLGASARRIRVQALFYGDDYESRMAAFVQVLGFGGEGDLIHPVFGWINVAVAGWSAPHRADDPDYCLMSVEFVEVGVPVGLFDKSPAQGMATAIHSVVDRAQSLAGAQFAKQIGTLAAAATNGRQSGFLSDSLAGALSAVRLLSPSTALANLPGISQPLSWASDVRAIVGALRDTTRLAASFDTFDPLTLFADFFGFTGLLAGWPPIETPKDSYGQRVSNTVAAQLNLTPSLEVARVTSDILAQEAILPTLSPAEIGRIADDCRARIQSSIDECAAAYDLVDGRPLIEALRETAHGVLEAARAVIEARPPIISRQVETDCNLHRLAHLWYGDWQRAYELQRLNPQVRNPNFVSQGAVLNAYAS